MLFIVVILSRRIAYVTGCKILEHCTPAKFHDFECGCLRYGRPFRSRDRGSHVAFGRSLLFMIMVPVLCWSAYKFVRNYSYVHLGHLFCP